MSIKEERLTTELCTLLVDAIKGWERAAASEEACFLAAKAYILLKDRDPKQAQRFNGLLHALTRNVAHTGSDVGREPASELDVRPLPPAERHRLIFETWHRLNPGQAFTLLNDHDPKPLYYQFAAEHPNQFTWIEGEMGPAVWRVTIGKAGR